MGKLITIILTVITFILIILVGNLALRQTGQQFYNQCSQHEWEGTWNYSGDFSGNINCDELRIKLFDNNDWVDKCSDFPFSPKPSCKWMCIEDCKIENKLAGENICVC